MVTGTAIIFDLTNEVMSSDSGVNKSALKALVSKIIINPLSLQTSLILAVILSTIGFNNSSLPEVFVGFPAQKLELILAPFVIYPVVPFL